MHPVSPVGKLKMKKTSSPHLGRGEKKLYSRTLPNSDIDRVRLGFLLAFCLLATLFSVCSEPGSEANQAPKRDNTFYFLWGFTRLGSPVV